MASRKSWHPSAGWRSVAHDQQSLAGILTFSMLALEDCDDDHR